MAKALQKTPNKSISPLLQQAIRRYQALAARASRSPLKEPTAATLATADGRGRPSSRTVLVKEASERGFVFYTNLTSRKARELKANPRAALCFFWQPLMEQVVVEGSVERVSRGEADIYWLTRPRNSKIAAWVSLQSQPLASRGLLNARIAKYAAKFAWRQVPRPPAWSGYRVIPDRIEFWKVRPFRLHERVLYRKREGRWTRSLLYP